jgi:hypothetical protein
MFNPEPTWSFGAKNQLTQWYGHVHLLKEHVIGQWFVLNRGTGECLWEHGFHRANSIFETVDDVILASEMRSDGPWTADFGCSGISLTKGELLWRWYGNGIWGRLVRALDYVPGFTNDLRTSFVGVRGTECATRRGDILDIRTGQKLRRESDVTAWKKDYASQTPSQNVYHGQRVEVCADRWLSLREAQVKVEQRADGVSVYSSPIKTRPFGFVLSDSQNKVLWDWSPEDINLKPITNFYGWRLVGTRLLVLGSEEPDTVPINPEKPVIVRRNLTRYHLLVVDALSGQVLQRLGVTTDKVSECRIEDANESGVLLSSDNKHLRYYALTPAG